MRRPMRIGDAADLIVEEAELIVMTDVLNWAGLALGAALIVAGLMGFWRGLSLQPTDPRSRPPERLWW